MSLVAVAYHQDGKTHITVRESDPETFFVCNPIVDGDFSKASNAELVNLALDWISKKYINEYEVIKSSEKIKGLEQAIEQYEKLIQKASLTIAKTKEQMEEQQQTSTTAQMTLMSVIYKLNEKGLLTDEELNETITPETEMSL